MFEKQYCLSFFIFWSGVMNECRLCPRNCGVNRDNGEIGYCGCGSNMVIARYSLHMWEEPCISGDKGSGTIFFSYCNLRCVFCQNYDISNLHKGCVVSIKEFSDICIKLQNSGACNINLVTGVMYIPLIIEGLRLAKKKGLIIPIVYNSSGYENVSAIKMLDGLVDIYLPDFKYYDDRLALKYSKCGDYFKNASETIREMYRQVGDCVFDDDGMMKKGVIVRHLMLPSNKDDSKMIIRYLYDTYGDSIFISIMNQYTPLRFFEYDELNDVISDRDYNEIIDFAYDLGIRNAYVQDGETQRKSFIPDFDCFCGIE